MTDSHPSLDRVGRVAITGANGFIGRAVVSDFTRAGAEVVPVVRHCDGVVGERCVGEIGSSTDWCDVLEGVDVVIHAAALAHGRGRSAGEYVEVNVEGTRRLARQAAECGVRRLVFLSSVGVMGAESFGRPLTENDEVAPHNFYAGTKADAEAVLWDEAAATGLEVVVVRPPLVYGPQAPGNFARLVRWLDSGFPLPLGGVKANRRSLLALDNLVDFLMLCTRHTGAAGEAFLISDGEDIATADLLHRMARSLGQSPRLLPIQPAALGFSARMLGKGELARQLLGSLQVDISKARDELGWEPPVSVDEGLRRAVEPYRHRRRDLSREG